MKNYFGAVDWDSGLTLLAGGGFPMYKYCQILSILSKYCETLFLGGAQCDKVNPSREAGVGAAFQRHQVTPDPPIDSE